MPSEENYRVHQRSVLGAILFSIFFIPLFVVPSRLEISYHCYSDDTLSYIVFQVS